MFTNKIETSFVRRMLLVAVLASATAATAQSSAPGTPLSPAFFANPAAPGTSPITYNPGIGRAADGSFVVIWQSADDTVACFGQRFNADGSPNGSQFQIAAPLNEFSCQIAMNAAGQFVASWFTIPAGSLDYHLFAQRYSADGVAQGAVIDVATIPANVQNSANMAQAAAMDDTGGFSIAWRYQTSVRTKKSDVPTVSNTASLYGRIYNNNGKAASSAFLIQQDPTTVTIAPIGSLIDVQLATVPGGDVIFCWDELGGVVDVQRFAHDGTAVGKAFDATAGDGLQAPTTGGIDGIPQIAMQPSGGYVLAWQTGLQSPVGAYAIAARLFSSSDIAIGPALTVASLPSALSLPAGVSVASDSAGNFVVAWALDTLSGSNQLISLQGQFFNASGIPAGATFAINSNDAMTYLPLHIAVDASGDLAATWVGFDSSYNSFATVGLFSGL